MASMNDAPKKTTTEIFSDLLKQVAHVPMDTARMNPALIGRTIGHFRIESHIGSGGMGAVYLATDELLHRKVAVKILPYDVAESPARRALLLREARSAAAVSHVNVAAVHEVGEHGGHPYIAMEYVQGVTLRALLARGPLSRRDALSYAVQIARGLARAHKIGIIHRDLKPDNVIIDSEGIVKILDFGLAKSLADAQKSAAGVDPPSVPERASGVGVTDVAETRIGWGLLSRTPTLSGFSGAGTPAYMAPEQISGRSTDARADVFSFGATVFEMLTGRPGRPNERLPWRTPRRLARVVERCLSDTPSRRFADGQALESALRPRSAVHAPAAALALLTIGVVATTTAMLTHRAPPAGEPRREELEQVTFNSSEAPVYAAALSPDGALLAYIEPRGVFIRDIAKRTTRRLETTQKLRAFWGCVAWYPDGKRVLLGAAHEDGRSDLWTADVDGGAARPMELGNWLSFGAVSPDGGQLAIVQHTGAMEGSLEIVSVSGGTPKVLYETRDEELFSSPRWSPDGRRVAFVRGVKTTEFMTHHIDVVDVATGARRTVFRSDRLAQDAGEVAFDWSRDGRLFFALAPSTVAPDQPSLYSIAPDDLHVEGSEHELAKIRPEPGLAGIRIKDLSFDATGKHMVLVRSEGQADVMAGALAPDGTRLDDVRRLTLSDENERPSSWSRDSQSVLMVSDAAHTYGISSLALGGSRAPEPITDAERAATWPVLGPAGKGILYWRIPVEDAPRARIELWLAEPGKAARKVYATPREVHLPGRGRPPPRRWSVRCGLTAPACFLSHPDDSGKGETVLEALDVDRGTATPVSRFAGIWDYGFALSADARQIAVHAPSRLAVDIYTLDGARVRQISTPSASFFSFIVWDHSGDGVIAAGSSDDFPLAAIVHLGLDGTVHPLWGVSDGLISNLAIAPDGRHLAFAATPFHANVWLRKK